MKANRIAQLALAAGLALTVSVPALAASGAPANAGEPAQAATLERKAQDRKDGEFRRHGARHHGQHHHGKRHGDMMLRGLDLTDAQKADIKALREAAAPDMRAAMKDAFEARKQLRELTLSGKFDQARAETLAKTGADAMAKASVLKAKTDSEVLALLTPEQRQTMTERAERMKERMQERQEKRQQARQAGAKAEQGEPAKP